MRPAHVLLIGLMVLAATVDGQSQAGNGAKGRAQQKKGTATPPSPGRSGAPSASGKGQPPVPPPQRNPPGKKKGVSDLFNGKGNPKQTRPAPPTPPPGSNAQSNGGNPGRPAQPSAEARAQFDSKKKDLARSRDNLQQQAKAAAAEAMGSPKPASSGNTPKTAFAPSGARRSAPVRRAPTTVPGKAGGKPVGSGTTPAEATTKSSAQGKQSWGSRLFGRRDSPVKKATEEQRKTSKDRNSKPQDATKSEQKGEKFFSNLRKKLGQQAKMFSNVHRQKDSGL